MEKVKGSRREVENMEEESSAGKEIDREIFY